MTTSSATIDREQWLMVRWLFNPFYYLAGGKALGLGLVAILLAGIIAHTGKTRFDGVLDYHVLAHYNISVWTAMSEGLAWWAILSLLLLIAGKIFSKSKFRSIDVVGTQALARAPFLFAALVGLLVGIGESPGVSRYILVTILILTMLVWMVWLMYKGFSHSCNLRGGKAAAIFIVCLVTSEIASKALLVAAPQTGAQGGPVVVETVPASQAVDVDPTLNEIKVTFSKKMLDKSWSWCLEDKSSFPQMAGDPYYENDYTTAVLPVKLEPGKQYVVWVNRGKYNNFQDLGGNRVKDYRLTFTTGGKGGTTAGQGAQQEAGCKVALASELLQLLVKEEFGKATANFDATMKKHLPADKLKGAWASIQSQAGAFMKELGVRTSQEQGYEIVYVTCEFEKAPLDMKVVFDSAGKIAGLFFVPAQ